MALPVSPVSRGFHMTGEGAVKCQTMKGSLVYFLLCRSVFYIYFKPLSVNGISVILMLMLIFIVYDLFSGNMSVFCKWTTSPLCKPGSV